MNSVTIEEYKPTWQDSYQEEHDYLARQFKACEPRIEHVGSTSIKIDAKPIVDIAIGLETLDSIKQVDFKALAEKRWFRIKKTFADEVVLAKYTDDSYQKKSHYAHVVVEGSKRWQEMVNFRDKLINSEALRREYVELKRFLANKYCDDVDRYSEAKKEFVLSVVSS